MQAASARTHRGLYLRICEGHALLLSPGSDFTYVTLSATKESESHTIRVVGVVVVDVTVVVHIIEVSGVVRRTQPPVSSEQNDLQRITREIYLFPDPVPVAFQHTIYEPDLISYQTRPFLHGRIIHPEQFKSQFHL